MYSALEVWLGLAGNFKYVISLACAASAWDNRITENGTPYSKNPFLNTAAIAIKIHLLSEISKYFDKECSCGNDNCSLQKLKVLCKSDEYYSNRPQVMEFVGKIDELATRFEKVISKKVRNKILAHNDLNTIFSGNLEEICFYDVYSLVRDTATLLNNILVCFVGVKYVLTDYSNAEKRYIESLDELLFGEEALP